MTGVAGNCNVSIASGIKTSILEEMSIVVICFGIVYITDTRAANSIRKQSNVLKFWHISKLHD